MKTEIKISSIFEVIFVMISRSLFFFLTQIVFFGFYLIILKNNEWLLTAKYWPIFALSGGIISIIITGMIMKRDNEQIMDFYKFEKKHIFKDIITITVILLLLSPLVLISNILSTKLLFEDPTMIEKIMFQKLPLWALITSFLFPVVTALTEIPVYYGFVLPKLSKQMSVFIAMPAVIFFHLFQHCFLPFMFDIKFIIWRFIMFTPLAVILAITIYARRRLMPYLIIIHMILDFSAVMMFFK